MNSGGALDAGSQYRTLLKDINAEFKRLFEDLSSKVQSNQATSDERYDFAAIRFWES